MYCACSDVWRAHQADNTQSIVSLYMSDYLLCKLTYLSIYGWDWKEILFEALGTGKEGTPEQSDVILPFRMTRSTWVVQWLKDPR